LRQAAQLTGIPAMANSAPTRIAIECVAGFPDDQLESGTDIIRPGGRGMAIAMVELLRGAGVTASEPSLDFEHGWEFVAERDGRKFWILVTDLEKTKLIQTKDLSSLLIRLFSGQAAYAAFLELLYRALSNDARFRSVEWAA
jgi:hypothetical protein